MLEIDDNIYDMDNIGIESILLKIYIIINMELRHGIKIYKISIIKEKNLKFTIMI